MEKQVTVNPDQRLFVIPHGDNGYSCFGYDNCFKDLKQLAQMLKRPDLAPSESEIGTVKQYNDYRKVIEMAAKGPALPTWFDPDTKPAVKRVLESLIGSDKPVRIFYGADDGKSWMDEYDMYGRISRSTGTLKCPLICQPRSHGGMAILTDRIIRIQTFERQGSRNVPRILYADPKFHVPPMRIQLNEYEGYAATVMVNDQPHARFTSEKKAQRWIDFMLGLVPTT